MASDVDGILSEIEDAMKNLVKNDKIVINSLSFLAEDYKENKEVYPRIVSMIENKLRTVPVKLPFLYLIDSIMKNVGEPYISAFSTNLVQIFAMCFEETQDPHPRRKLYDLRKTWVDVFPSEKLFALDRRVNAIDPAWPIASHAPDEGRVIHINPKFLKSEKGEDTTTAQVPDKILNPPSSGKQSTTTSSSHNDDRRHQSQTEVRPSRPLQLPLPPFYHDVPRPNAKEQIPSSLSKRKADGNYAQSSKPTASSALRDPRLQKGDVPEKMDVDRQSNDTIHNGEVKRPKMSSSAIKKDGNNADEDIDRTVFIDRMGDNSIEKKAAKRKAKKVNKKQLSQKKEDQDLRLIDMPLPPVLPSLPPPPSTLTTSSDIDMRLPPSQPTCTVPPTRPPQQQFMRPQQHTPQMRMNMPPSRPQPPFNRPPHMNHPRPMRNGPRMPPPRVGPPCGMPYPRPMMNCNNVPDMPPQMPHGRPPFCGTPGMRPPQRPNVPGSRVGPLKIDKPRWFVKVAGLDDLPNIGVDPRLLNPCAHDPDQSVQEVTINGCSYTLLLDRLQPLIHVNGFYHAVRFRVECLELLFSNRLRVQVPGNNFLRMKLGSRFHTMCIGGPHHELIIDGRPYSLNFNGDFVTIPLKDNVVTVKLTSVRPRSLDVLPAIPPQILKWAMERYFGPASMLHLPPLNPVERMELIAAGNRADQEMNNQVIEPSRQPDPQANIAKTNTNNTIPPVTQVAPTAPVNVFNLFDQLVKHGLVEKQTKLDLDDFKLTNFLEANEASQKSLYEGFQCSQCGRRYFNPESEEFTAHLDYHFITNNSGKQSGGKSRSYFETVDVWLLGTCGPAGQDDSGSESGFGCRQLDEDRLPTVEASPDDNLNVCSVCFEKFEIKYSDEDEAWLLINAVKKDGLFYHPICVEDAWKGVAVDMAIDPHLALKKVLEGKMDAVYKPEAAEESTDSSEDGVQVIVKSRDGEEEKSTSMEVSEAPENVEEERNESSENTENNLPSNTDDIKSEPHSPATPLQDELQCEPSTPLKDETPFLHSDGAGGKSCDCGLSGNPQTPVQDETLDSSLSTSAQSPGTPVRDEIDEPGTPVKDEPIWT